MDVLELLDGIRVDQLPGWAKIEYGSKLTQGSSDKIFLNCFNDSVAQLLTQRFKELGIESVRTKESCTLYLYEVTDDKNIFDITADEFLDDKSVLFFCSDEIASKITPIPNNPPILRYNISTINNFLDTVETWLVIKLKL